MLATNMAESGSPEEKLRWAFKMYDKDGSGGFLKPDSGPESQKVCFSGTVDVDEMVEIVCNLYEMEGISKVTFHISAIHKQSAS